MRHLHKLAMYMRRIIRQIGLEMGMEPNPDLRWPHRTEQIDEVTLVSLALEQLIFLKYNVIP